MASVYKTKSQEFKGLGLHLSLKEWRVLKAISRRDSRSLIGEIKWLIQAYSVGDLDRKVSQRITKLHNVSQRITT